MHDFIIVVISVIASLTADAALDYFIFRNNKIGTKEFRDALKYPKAAEQQQQEILRQLAKLENSLSRISTVSYSDIEAIRRDIEELKRKLVTSGTVSTAPPSSEKEQQIVDILKNLASRISTIESNQKSTNSNEELLDYIRRIEAETKQDLQSLNSKIDRLGDSTTASPATPPKPSASIPQPRFQTYTPENRTVVVPSSNYVQTLIIGVTQLESSTSSISYELGKLKDGLLNVKKNGDFDDLEEVMNQIHDLIKKYIYDSDSKVSADEWKMLEQFLIHSGYEPIPVKEGDSIIPYRTYFERPIPAAGGPTDTIKQIQLMPFVLSYSDCGETEVLKLCGKCTYYK